MKRLHSQSRYSPRPKLILFLSKVDVARNPTPHTFRAYLFILASSKFPHSINPPFNILPHIAFRYPLSCSHSIHHAMLSKAALFTILTATFSIFSPVKASSDVLDLSEADFDETLKTNHLVLAEFFAPWVIVSRTLLIIVWTL
jgi:hypothetical protein